MGDSHVISDMSETLQKLLRDALNRPGQLVNVTVDSPRKEYPDEFRVNLFLYQMVRDPHRSRPMRTPTTKSSTQQEFIPEPLVLDLYYLLTAYAADGLSEQRLLGESMSVLFRNQKIPEAAKVDSLQTLSNVIQVVMLNLEREAISDIWGSHTDPIRTSVAYEVQSVFMEMGDRFTRDLVTNETEWAKVDLVPVPALTYIYPEEAPVGEVIRIYGANLSLPYLQVWFGDVVAAPTSQSPGIVRVIVPEGVSSGTQPVRLQLESYYSAPRDFKVLP